jgi:hypothetical protein
MWTLADAPDNTDALRILAWLENQAHNYDKAYFALRRAANLKPQDIELQSELASAEAIARRFRAIRYEPTMFLVLTIVGVSILTGYASSTVTGRTYALIFGSTCFLAGVALAWLYVMPIN